MPLAVDRRGVDTEFVAREGAREKFPAIDSLPRTILAHARPHHELPVGGRHHLRAKLVAGRVVVHTKRGTGGRAIRRERLPENVPSPGATYDLQPEMSAVGITDAIMDALKTQSPDFVCLNYANTDMVGHTGVWAAAKIAAETVDNCLAKLVPAALSQNYALIIIADHGNSDFLINADGSPNTAHTTNPVPCILVANDLENNKKIALKKGKLADLAPTILKLMNVEIPKEMTGELLLF